MRSEAALLPANPSPPLNSPAPDSLHNAPCNFSLSLYAQDHAAVGNLFSHVDFTLLDFVEIQIGTRAKNASVLQIVRRRAVSAFLSPGFFSCQFPVAVDLFREKKQHRV